MIPVKFHILYIHLKFPIKNKKLFKVKKGRLKAKTFIKSNLIKRTTWIQIHRNLKFDLVCL